MHRQQRGSQELTARLMYAFAVGQHRSAFCPECGYTDAIMQNGWESWGKPIIQGLLTGIPLMLGGAYAGAYLTDTPIKHTPTLSWVVELLLRPVPMWFAFVFAVFGIALTVLYLHQRAVGRLLRAAQTKTAETHAAAIAALQQRLAERQAPSNSAADTVSEIPQRADLQFSGAKVARLFYGLARTWKESENGYEAMIFPVLNPVAPVGHKGMGLERLSANIRFETLSGRVCDHVSRAYWLNHSENAIDLKCGSTEAIVVGALQQPHELTVYDNPNEYAVAPVRFRNGMTLPQPPSRTIPFWEALRVTLSLVTTEDDKTVEVISLVLEPSPDGKSLIVGSYR